MDKRWVQLCEDKSKELDMANAAKKAGDYREYRSRIAKANNIQVKINLLVENYKKGKK